MPVTDTRHPIQGGGYSMKDLKFINRDHINGYIQVTNKEAIKAARLLARHEGIFAGYSSGANLAAAIKLLNKELKGKTLVILINDSGLKYLSTNLWD
jgi:cysteine synthase